MIVIAALKSRPVSASPTADAEHCAHLTIDWVRIIHQDKSKYDGRKGGYPRKGIELPINEKEYQVGEASVTKETKVKRMWLRTHIVQW